MIQDILSDNKDTTFAVPGNHDQLPNWVQNPFEESYQLKQMAPLMKEWLSEEQINIFTQHGYFSKSSIVKGEKFRVIGINTNSFNNYNKWVISVLADPNKQIGFLERELEEAEREGESAILIGHIPPAEWTYTSSVMFQALCERYASIIKLNLFGHTHKEEIRILDPIQSDYPVTGLFLCGSLTTWEVSNPGFCVYELDPATLLPVKWNTYRIDLNEANEKREAHWRLYHEFKGDYGLPDLKAKTLKEGVVDKIKSSEEVSIKYHNNQSKNSTVGRIEKCDEKCKKEHYCMIVSNRPFANDECMTGTGIDFINKFHDSFF